MSRVQFSGGRPVPDEDICSYIDDFDFLHADLGDASIHHTFLNTMRRWISDSQLNTISLKDYPHQSFINGVTESIDHFALQHANKRFILLKGEFSYWKKIVSNYEYYSSDIDLDPRFDVFVMSAPFSATGSLPPFNLEVLEQMDNNNIPTFIDCCWFGTCHEINFDSILKFPCVDVVSFSLSKSLNLPFVRAGARFSRDYIDDGITDNNKDNYVNRLAAKLGIELMNGFSADYIPSKYLSASKRLAEDYSLQNTKCVNLCSGDYSWRHLQRDDLCNRLCVSETLLEYL